MAEEKKSNKKPGTALLIFYGLITFGLYFIFRKTDKKKSWMREWADALVFAVIAATIIRTFLIEAFTIPTPSMEKTLLVGDFLFVSKINYGARVPNTPLSFPFAHHTLPLTKSTKSYLEWISLPYMRLPGIETVENNDVVVFNYPMEADEPFNRPVDKRENYIKRCIAIAGDTLKIVNREIFINGKAAHVPDKSQYNYHVKTDGTGFNPKKLKELDITDGAMISNQGDYQLTLTSENAGAVNSFANVDTVSPMIEEKGMQSLNYFPNDTGFHWNLDNYGPIYIPKEGQAIKLTKENLPLYKRLITVYEHHELKVDGDKIMIDGKVTDTYTPIMNYYWMMGDNRHNSLDSRFWGFVPEDHVVGKAIFIWLSLDNTAESLFSKIRWNRLFTVINDNNISRSFFLPVLILGVLIYFIIRYRRKKAAK